VADSAWEAIFMLVVLKIPMVYLAVVVWWAIRSEPVVGFDDDRPLEPVPLVPCGWDERRRRSLRTGRGVRPRPRGGMPRPVGGARAAHAAAGRR
jgi:nitrogen fixation-related uncharacterized protein